MWFRNLSLYRLPDVEQFDAELLEQALAGQGFTSCAPHRMESLGWVPPMGPQSEQLVHIGSGMYLVTARREQRLLPATVVREALEKHMQEFERAEGRPPGRRRQSEMRDQLTFEMMPRAFTRSTLIQGLILPERNALVIDTASRKVSDEWVALLRDTLPDLSVVLPVTRRTPSEVFTGWVSGRMSLPLGMRLGEECVLTGPDQDSAVVRCQRLNLAGGEVAAHLSQGMQVTRLAVDWPDAFSLVLTGELDVRKFSIAHTRVEQSDMAGVNDSAAEFDARFHLAGQEISRLIPILWDAFGGLTD